MYAVGTTIHNATSNGSLTITARNEEKRLYRLWNGDKSWTVSHDQLERHGWTADNTPNNRELNPL